MAASMHPPFEKDERIEGAVGARPERVRRSDYVVGLAGLTGAGVVVDPFGESALSESAAEPWRSVLSRTSADPIRLAAS
jgi:hypothetical protein